MAAIQLPRTPACREAAGVLPRQVQEFGANPLKVYRRRYSDSQVMAMAMKRQAERLATSTPAEIAFETILKRLGIKHVRETVVRNGDRFVLLDFWLKKWNLVVELDGRHHDDQKTYDHDRSMWLAREHGMKIVRFANHNVFNGNAELRIREMLGVW